MLIENTNENLMYWALGLAGRAFGRTSPNPLVGSVVVRNGKVVGEGWHKRAGSPHAEVDALKAAGKNAEGATLYVNLEPCSTTGRTPPCVEAIISAKIAKVVIGCLDPNPSHAGRGVKILRDAGIDVVTGVLQEECERLNEAFFHWITTGRPFVLLKLAATLDGKIATASGQSKWITGAKAREKVQAMRQWADAVMVGGETARRDRPSLTVRGIRGWKQPRRIVASRSLSQDDASILLGEAASSLVVSAENKSEWISILERLGTENVTALLVEGGGVLAHNLLSLGLVNKLAYFIAPKILAGNSSRPAFSGGAPQTLDDAYALEKRTVEEIGEDILITGYPTSEFS